MDSLQPEGPSGLFEAAVLGDHTAVRELLAKGADVNERAEDGRTALHVAAERGHERIVALLRNRPDADLNAKDSLGRTALTLAAFNGRLGAAEELLADPRTDPNLVDRDRQTALHWAVLGGHADVVRALLADSRTNAGILNRPGGETAHGVAVAAGQRAAAAVLEERMSTDPGTDELSPGDDPGEQTEEAPLFFSKPFVPESPGLRERRPS
jgi:ankyrin repeat protein